jgi:deoxycytidylate deaminase
MHAEMDLLRKLGNKSVGSKIYIYRFNNAAGKDSRQNKNGKPCLLCQHCLKHAGIARVHYLDDSSQVCTIKNRDMIELIGEPKEITCRFLDRFAENRHGKFDPVHFVASK